MQDVRPMPSSLSASTQRLYVRPRFSPGLCACAVIAVTLAVVTFVALPWISVIVRDSVFGLIFSLGRFAIGCAALGCVWGVVRVLDTAIAEGLSRFRVKRVVRIRI